MKLKILWVTILVTVSGSLASAQPESLQKYRINKSKISISGVSSGAFMATQMGVAYSGLFKSVASIAGGIYWCAQGQSIKAQGECMKSAGRIQPETQINYAKDLAAAKKIDPLKNLRKQRLYILASPTDRVIRPPAGDKLMEFAQEFYDPQNIRYENTLEFGHGFPTQGYGVLCQFGFLPWLLSCGFDTAGEILNHAYGPLWEKVPQYFEENLSQFDQEEFFASEASLYSSGWVYVPTSCRNGKSCGLHVALHGCQMNPDYIHDLFVRNAGFNEWAETNNLIVLYPQSASVLGHNLSACWDWFGFTGDNYVEKDGAQMRALRAMISRITGF